MIPCEATEIRGPHGVHGFYLKILLKIFVKMSSRKAIPIKPLPRSEELERILVRILFKDYYFWPKAIFFIKDFLQRFLGAGNPQNIRINSV